MNRPPIELNTFHHVFNRGTEKRPIYMDDEDRKLFLKYLEILNDADIESPSKGLLNKETSGPIHNRLVNLCAFCMMPNHFHLLLYECIAGGISKFMQRLGTAYTMFFNEKYERSGALFQGGFKSKQIEDEAYLMHVIDYLHINPIQHKNEDGTKIDLRKRDLVLLDSHAWSSYGDYCGQDLHPRLLQREVLDEYLEMPKDYRAWLLGQGDFEDIRSFAIDL